MAEMLLFAEIITRCIFIVMPCLTLSQPLACLPAKSICLTFHDVKWISASHQRYSNLSPITRQLSSIIQWAPYGVARTYKNDLLKSDVILEIFVEKIQRRCNVERKREERLTESAFSSTWTSWYRNINFWILDFLIKVYKNSQSRKMVSINWILSRKMTSRFL